MSWFVDLNLAYIFSFGLESEVSDFVFLEDGLLLKLSFTIPPSLVSRIFATLD